ncbi:amidohydrolase family protein [Leeia oryzae]|uniref:amidohydrolase family protein n=1 Tax=Leeia oryzae TaxID=356662 RepID=UPI00039A84FD|nr:amidohydrolase family protein [Leeia oryzae]
MNQAYWLRNIRPDAGKLQDIRIENGLISAYRAASQTPVTSPDIDGEHQILTLPFVESHIHLDKTLWGLPWLPHSAGPNLQSRIDNEKRILLGLTTPVSMRAASLLEHCIAKGSLTFRCHVDIDPLLGMQHVEDMLAVRDKYQDWAHIQYVAFPQRGLIIQPGVAEMMAEALAKGLDVVGGLDPCGIDRDPIAHLTSIFELAASADTGVDIHLHDAGELGLWEIERIADFTERYQRQGRVMISHAFCLGTRHWTALQALADRLAALQISIMTTAPADIEAPPFALLTAAGVNVCLGSDGIRDAWSPFGNGDMLERAAFLAMRFDARKDEDLQAAFTAATRHGAKALGLSDPGLQVGSPADFLLMPGETLAEVVATRPATRTVIKAGRVIAKGGQLLHSRLDR